MAGQQKSRCDCSGLMFTVRQPINRANEVKSLPAITVEPALPGHT
jgi:hypothetical protein